jgi:hypothetical protein
MIGVQVVNACVSFVAMVFLNSIESGMPDPEQKYCDDFTN